MKTLNLSILLLLLNITVKAQVGINILNPDTTAIFHIHSDNKGVLLPVLSGGVRNSLAEAAPTAEGLLIYDSIDKVYYFFNLSTKKWLALNPFQTADEEDKTGAGGDDIKLASRFNNRNVVIGGDTAVDYAKLHVKGNIKSDSTLYAKSIYIDTELDAKNVHINERIDVKYIHISDSIWSQKIGASSLISTTANINSVYATTIHSNSIVPIDGIIMWTDDAIPPCWEIVGEMGGRFPVGAGTIGHREGTLGIEYLPKQRGGQDTVTLKLSELPRHNHDFAHSSSDHNTGTGGLLGSSTTMRIIGGSWYSDKISDTGGNQPHENRPPFYAVYFIKKTSNNCP